MCINYSFINLFLWTFSMQRSITVNCKSLSNILVNIGACHTQMAQKIIYYCRQLHGTLIKVTHTNNTHTHLHP